MNYIFSLFLLLCWSHYSYSQVTTNCKDDNNVCLESSYFSSLENISVFFPRNFFNSNNNQQFVIKIYHGDLSQDPVSDFCKPSKNGISISALQEWTVTSPQILPGYTTSYYNINISSQKVIDAMKDNNSFYFQVSIDGFGGSQCLLGPLKSFTHISFDLSLTLTNQGTPLQPSPSKTSEPSQKANATPNSSSSSSNSLSNEAIIGIGVACALVFLILLILLFLSIKRSRKAEPETTEKGTEIPKSASSSFDDNRPSFNPLISFEHTVPLPTANDNPFDDKFSTANEQHQSALLIAESYRNALNKPIAESEGNKRQKSDGSRKSTTLGDMVREI